MSGLWKHMVAIEYFFGNLSYISGGFRF